MVFDPTEGSTLDKELFIEQDWIDSVYAATCTDIKEALPTNMPKACGISSTTRSYVDADHAGDSTTQRTTDWIPNLSYLNSFLIYRHSNK